VSLTVCPASPVSAIGAAPTPPAAILRDLLTDRLKARHRLVDRALPFDNRYAIRAAISGWIATRPVQV